jgi:uncharacterized membrane protein
MSLPLVSAVASGILYALAGFGYKMAERMNCRTANFIVVFSIAGGVFALVKSFSEASEWSNPQLWFLGIGMGILFDLAIYFIMLSNKAGPASLSWTLLNLSLLVPIALSPLLFQERVLWIDPFIVLTFILMLALFAQSIRKNEETSLRSTGNYFLMLLGIFLSNGFFLLGNRLKHELFGEANTAALTFVVFLVGGLIAWLVTVQGKERNRIGLNEWKAGGLTGLSNSIGTIFYLGAMSFPAAVVFPLNASIALLGGVVLTTSIYGEKFDTYKIGAMGVGTIALLLAIFREQII